MDSQRLHVEALTQQLSSLVFDFSSQLCCSNGGTLCQVWMPEEGAVDSALALTAKGLPFCLTGVSDLLALFRCVSLRYRFSSNAHDSGLMGAVGRVYHSLQPEMSANVQAYDRKVYLRVSEAKRCHVHSIFMAPLFHESSPNQPVAVFELAFNDKGAITPALLTKFSECVEACGFTTCDWDGLRVPYTVAKESLGLNRWSSSSRAISDDSSWNSSGELGPLCVAGTQVEN
eukprot:gene23797-9360_t